MPKVARRSSAWDATPSYLALLRSLAVVAARGTVVPCADRRNDWRWWFSDEERFERRAKSLCGDCVLMAKCGAHALLHNEHGVWGGTTERERRAFRMADGTDR